MCAGAGWAVGGRAGGFHAAAHVPTAVGPAQSGVDFRSLLSLLQSSDRWPAGVALAIWLASRHLVLILHSRPYVARFTWVRTDIVKLEPQTAAPSRARLVSRA